MEPWMRTLANQAYWYIQHGYTRAEVLSRLSTNQPGLTQRQYATAYDYGARSVARLLTLNETLRQDARTLARLETQGLTPRQAYGTARQLRDACAGGPSCRGATQVEVIVPYTNDQGQSRIYQIQVNARWTDTIQSILDAAADLVSEELGGYAQSIGAPTIIGPLI